MSIVAVSEGRNRFSDFIPEVIFGKITRTSRFSKNHVMIYHLGDHEYIVKQEANGKSSIIENNKNNLKKIRDDAAREAQQFWSDLYTDLVDNDNEDMILKGVTEQLLLGDLLFPFIHELKYAEWALTFLTPDKVILQSGSESIRCSAYRYACTKLGIGYKVIEPTIYSYAKKQVIRNTKNKMIINSLRESPFLHKKSALDNNSILFFVPYINWYRTVEPLINKLCIDEDFSIFIQAGLFEPKVPGSFRTKEYNVDVENSNILAKDAQNLKSKLFDVVEGNRSYPSKSVGYMKDIIMEYVLPEVCNVFSTILPKVASNISWCSAVVEKMKPAALVLATGPRSYLLGGMPSVCNQKGIPILEFQHGIFRDMEIQYFEPFMINKVCCWDLNWASRYSNCGVPQQCIEVIGWPKLSMYDWGSCGSNGVKNILIATQPEYRLIFKNIINTLDKMLLNRGWTIYVKPHPSEQSSYYEKIVKNLENTVILDSKLNIQPFLDRANLVIVRDSTVGVEAALLGKKTICLGKDGEINHLYESLSRSDNIHLLKGNDDFRDILFPIMESIDSTEEKKNDKGHFDFGQSTRMGVDQIRKAIKDNLPLVA